MTAVELAFAALWAGAIAVALMAMVLEEDSRETPSGSLDT